MAAEMIAEQAPEQRPALTTRGEAVVLVLRLERLWPALSGADRRYIAPALRDLARQAGEG